MKKLIRKMSFVHPGFYLKNEIIDANNLTIFEAAKSSECQEPICQISYI